MLLSYWQLRKWLRWFRFLIFLLLWPAYCSHFAAETPLRILSAPNAANLSHFGFSLTAVTLNSKEKWPTLIVGAPRANNNEGAVYLCSSNADIINNRTTDACRQLPFTVNEQNSSLKHARIGTSVCSAAHDQSIFAVCAPGYITIKPSPHPDKNYHAFDGLCQLHINDSHIVNYHKCLASEDRTKDEYSNSSALPKSRGCLAGFSSVLVLSNELLHLGIGMPGDGHSGSSYFFVTRFNREGVLLGENYFSVAMEARNNMIGLSQTLSPNNVFVVPEISTFTQSDDMLLYFFKMPEQQVNADLDNVRLTNSINLRLNGKERPKSFEYFGFALASLKGPQRDSEIYHVVGAPFARDENQEVGCVYVIDATKMFAKTLFGAERQGHFGTSLLSVGDVTEDGRDDFVVGCPFCGKGVGAVYLYVSGGEAAGVTGYRLSQILRPSTTEWSRGFGWSLAGHVDMNLDGMPDLVVGAPLSDKVFVFRGLPTVLVENRDGSLIRSEVLNDYPQLRALNSSFRIVENWKLHLRFSKISAFKSSRCYQVILNPDASKTKSNEKRLTIVNDRNTVELNATILSSGYQLLTGQVELLWRPEQFLRDMRSPVLMMASLKVLPEAGKTSVMLLKAENQLLRKLRLLIPDCKCDGVKGNCEGDLQITAPNYQSGRPIVFYLNDWKSRAVYLELELSGVHQVWGAQLLLTVPKMVTLIDGVSMKMKGEKSYTKLEYAGEVTGKRTLTSAFSLLYPGRAVPLFDPMLGRIQATLRFELRLVSNFQLQNKSKVEEIVRVRTSTAILPGSLEFANCGNWTDSNPSNDGQDLRLTIVRDASLWMAVDQSKGNDMNFENRGIGQTLQGAAQGVIAVNRIGPRLLTAWHLKMNGSTPVDGLFVDLYVPMATSNGQRLLYLFKDLSKQDGQSLSTMPRLVHESNGSLIANCDTDSFSTIINPLNLTAVVGKSYLRSDRARRRRSTNDEQQQLSTGESVSFDFSSSSEPATPISIACGEKNSLLGQPQCALFRCKLPWAVSVAKPVQLIFDARLWADTFLRNGLSNVQVHVSARVRLPSTLQSSVEGILVNETWVVAVKQFYFSRAKGTTVVRINIWPIVVGVLVGILFLLAIIISLCRCGFFRRSRPDQEYKNVSLHEDDNRFSQ